MELDGLRWGVLLTVFLAGLRHGVDIDHLAAISDISSSQIERRRALFLSTTYALGHALVLMILGGVAVIGGERIPAALDSAMGRVIGATLVALGVYVIYSVIRYGRGFRLRSRWALVLVGLRRTLMWLRHERQPRQIQIVHDHPHPLNGHHSHTAPEEVAAGSAVTTKTLTHSHEHKHVVTMPADPFTDYGVATSFGIGMIHGVGAETPTQVLLFATAAGLAGGTAALALVFVFVLGLLLANTGVAIAAGYGFGGAGKRAPLAFVVLCVATAAMSLVVGTLYLLGRSDLLPGLLGG
jgi:hypothetical protein